MNLSAPWTPSLAGNELPSCKLFDDIVEKGTIPLTTSDPDWAKRTVFPAVSTLEEAGSLWETVVACWRLKQNSELGGEDSGWRDLAEAWLVRHCDLCEQAKIVPFEVIRDFGVFLASSGALERSRVPARLLPDAETGDIPTTIPTRSTVSETSGPNIAVETNPGATPTPATTTEGGPATRGRKRGQGRPEVVLELRKRSSTSKHDPGEADSSEKAKRPRVETGKNAPPLDLSSLEVEEDSAIDLELIPRLRDVKCKDCTNKKSCKPLWRRYDRGTPSIWCETCKGNRNGCSLARGLKRWGIGSMPTVVPSPGGNSRRSDNNAAKRRSRLRTAGDTSTTPKRTTRKQKLETAEPPPLSTSSLFSTSTTPSTMPTSSVHPGSLIFVDLVPFEEVLCDENRSISSLHDALIQVNTLHARERQDLRVATEVVGMRDRQFKILQQRLKDEAKQMAMDAGVYESLGEQSEEVESALLVRGDPGTDSDDTGGQDRVVGKGPHKNSNSNLEAFDTVDGEGGKGGDNDGDGDDDGMAE